MASLAESQTNQTHSSVVRLDRQENIYLLPCIKTFEILASVVQLYISNNYAIFAGIAEEIEKRYNISL